MDGDRSVGAVETMASAFRRVGGVQKRADECWMPRRFGQKLAVDLGKLELVSNIEPVWGLDGTAWVVSAA